LGSTSPSRSDVTMIPACGFIFCACLALCRPPLKHKRQQLGVLKPPRASVSTASTSALSSGLLLQVQPDNSVYSELPTFEHATNKWYGYSSDSREGILSELRDHLENCGLLDVVAVDLKHKHFDMPADCILLEEQHVDAKESVMKGAPLDAGAIPFSFKLSGDQWLPYEYVELHCEAAQQGLARVRACPSFLEKMSSTLKKYGLEDILGFHILHRPHLRAETGGTIETPGRASEELLIRPYSEALFRKNESFQVMWHWTEIEGSGGMCVACYCDHCGAHCNAHSS